MHCSPHRRRWGRCVPVIGRCCTPMSRRLSQRSPMPDLIAEIGVTGDRREEPLAPGAVLLRGFALPFTDAIHGALGGILADAPFRHMTTPWGAAMSVAMTN